MTTKRLGNKNVELLLNQYRAERKRLLFQLEKVRDTIGQLKEMRTEETPVGGDGTVKRGPGRPRKNPLPADGTVKRGPGRPRKNAAAKVTKKARKKRKVSPEGYKPSPWDIMVLANIEKKGRLLPKEDIVAHAKEWAKKNAPEMNDQEVEEKITRVLQKLSGTRGKLGTHRSGLRRGYHYGIKDWFFATSGKLRGQHLDKLVLN